MREQESMAALIAKMAPFLCPEFLPHRRILFQKIIAAPASMLINMDGTALRSCLLDGRDRTMQEWTGPHGNAVYYGRDCTKTLITRDGTALQRMDRTAPGRTKTHVTMDGTALQSCLLWTGPRRVGTETLITMNGCVFHPVTKLLHCISPLRPKSVSLRILYVYAVCAFCTCSDDARHLPQTRYVSNLDGAHFQFPCAWRACPHMLTANPGLESLILWHGNLPFSGVRNGTLFSWQKCLASVYPHCVCVYQWHIFVAMSFTIVACSGKQQYTSKTTSGIFKIVSMMTCRCWPLPR